MNLCARGSFPPVCKDSSNATINSHVCQIQPVTPPVAIDLGWLPSYNPLPGSDFGFIMRLSLGALGCGPRSGTGINIPRVTNITFQCDPLAGPGALKGASIVENPYCNYNFVWRSAYACPVCTENSYDFFYTPCFNGQRQKVYFWNDPKVCHDGMYWIFLLHNINLYC